MKKKGSMVQKKEEDGLDGRKKIENDGRQVAKWRQESGDERAK